MYPISPQLYSLSEEPWTQLLSLDLHPDARIARTKYKDPSEDRRSERLQCLGLVKA